MTRERKPKSATEMRGVIDRIEDGRVAVIVLDDGQQLHWPASRLPRGAREGMAVTLALAIDVQDTARRLDRTKELLQDIFSE